MCLKKTAFGRFLFRSMSAFGLSVLVYRVCLRRVIINSDGEYPRSHKERQ